jgi:N-acetylglutamate synthase-like GNAT family acetyltransferase
MGMNYIKKLETENLELQAQLKKVNSEITDFLVYLNSSKFAGCERDWINTTEVINRMRELRMETLV